MIRYAVSFLNKGINGVLLYGALIGLFFIVMFYQAALPNESQFYVQGSRLFLVFVLSIVFSLIVWKIYGWRLDEYTPEEKKELFGSKDYRPRFMSYLFFFLLLFPIVRIGVEVMNEDIMLPFKNEPYLMHYKDHYFKQCGKHECWIKNEKYFELDSSYKPFVGKLYSSYDPTHRSIDELKKCEYDANITIENNGFEYFCPLVPEPKLLYTHDNNSTEQQGYMLVMEGQKNGSRIKINHAFLSSDGTIVDVIGKNK